MAHQNGEAIKCTLVQETKSIPEHSLGGVGLCICKELVNDNDMGIIVVVQFRIVYTFGKLNLRTVYRYLVCMWSSA